MKIAFFGTPKFSAEILQDLIEKGMHISAVITQPDKLQGRHLKLQESCVKKVARALLPQVPLLQPERISHETFAHAISQIEADLFVVVAFGQIFPKLLLEMPRLGCVNVHTSLLPKYRGAAPIQRCLMQGETETGCTVMYMAEKCDAGDILAVKKIPIPPDMNAGELTLALCEISKDLLYPTLLKLADGEIEPQPQDTTKVTFAKKVTQEVAQVHWNHDAVYLYNQFRGVSPKPGAWCFVLIKGKKLRLKLIEVGLSGLSGAPGEILAYENEGIVIACKNKSLSLKTIQLEGKKALKAHSFIRGCSLEEVSFLESELTAL